MDFILKMIPDSLKLPAVGLLGAIVGAGLTFYPAKWSGASDERQAAQIQSAKEALVRVQDLEKSNANFRNLSERARCLVFMRDSGLPDASCDER